MRFAYALEVAPSKPDGVWQETQRTETATHRVEYCDQRAATVFWGSIPDSNRMVENQAIELPHGTQVAVLMKDETVLYRVVRLGNGDGYS